MKIALVGVVFAFLSLTQTVSAEAGIMAKEISSYNVVLGGNAYELLGVGQFMNPVFSIRNEVENPQAGEIFAISCSLALGVATFYHSRDGQSCHDSNQSLIAKVGPDKKKVLYVDIENQTFSIAIRDR